MSPVRSVAICVLLVASVAHAAEPTHLRDVIYGRAAGMALTLDVLKPATPSGVGILFMVSGGFSSDVSQVGKGLFQLGLFQPFIDRGFTIFLVGHGSQPKFTVAEIKPMIHRAVRYVRTHAGEYGVDPNRLGITGMSSGGFLSLTMGTTGDDGNSSADDEVDRASSRVQAVGCFCPPTDLVDYGEPGRTFLEYKPVEFVWHTIPVQDEPRDEQLRVLRELSPLAQITADDAPTLIFHGTRDELVPYEQAERFVEKLKEAGVEAELQTREGAGHAWPTIAEDFKLLAEWFDTHLPAK